MQAIAKLGAGGDMRAAGDPAIAGTCLLGVDPQSEGAPLAELCHIGDAEHGFSVGRWRSPSDRPSRARFRERSSGPAAPFARADGARPLASSLEDALTDRPLPFGTFWRLACWR
jgi:hypothetical protein